MYALFAVLSLIPYLGLTVTNKFVTNKMNEFVVATIKGIFYCLSCFILVCCMGHVATMGNVWQSPRTASLLIVNCLINGIGWVGYFFALKRSPLGLFNSTYLISKVLLCNTAGIIFNASIVTNGIKPLNVTIYVIALAALLGSLIATCFSKEAKEYGSRWWILVICVCNLSSPILQILMIKELPTNVIYEDVLLFYQSIFVIIANYIAVLVTKKSGDFKLASFKDIIILFISGALEVGFYYLFYRSLNAEGSNIAIANIIANCGLFVLVEIYEMIRKKTKVDVFHLGLFITLLVSMILMCLAGIV